MKELSIGEGCGGEGELICSYTESSPIHPSLPSYDAIHHRPHPFSRYWMQKTWNERGQANDRSVTCMN